jgi:alpha-beta hydrolase superfamily lysophospholipase
MHAISPTIRPHGPEPIYFGPGGSLFGMFHAAACPRPRTVAIVLCNPIGHEYFRVHRACRNIAVALSRLGFAVLRFDYYGTGDSHDSADAATLERWQGDVAAAVEEVRRRSRCARAAIVGLRLGATIAWLESLRRTDLDLLVMWEPIVNGRVYLERLRRLEEAWLTDPTRKAPRDAERAAKFLLGFPLSERLEEEVNGIDLAAGSLPATAHVVALFAEAAAPAEEAAWRERLVTAYGARSSAILPSGADWDDSATVHTAVYAQTAVQAIPAMFDKVIV